MSNVFFQNNNGADTTTDLNTVTATAIPMFGTVDSFSNHSNLFDDTKADEASMVIPTYTYPVSTNDVITLKTTRIYNDGGVVTYVSDNTSYVMIEVLSEPPTIMSANLSSTRTNYNLLSEPVKDIFINLLVLSKELSGNSYTQDVTGLITGEVDEYIVYLTKLGYACRNTAYTTLLVAW